MPKEEKEKYIIHTIGQRFYIEHTDKEATDLRFWYRAKKASDSETLEFIDGVFEGKVTKG